MAIPCSLVLREGRITVLVPSDSFPIVSDWASKGDVNQAGLLPDPPMAIQFVEAESQSGEI